MFVGVILTFVGLFFAALSIISGFLYNDTYPGYGNVGQKVNNYRDKIRKSFTSYAKDISKLFSDHNKMLQETFGGENISVQGQKPTKKENLN